MSRLALVLLLALPACEDATSTGVHPAPAGRPWDKLSQWGLFVDGARQLPAEGVHPYEVISPLFTDYAEKHRFFWVPEGAQVGYRADGPWDLPEGSIVIKTFAYPIDARDPSLGERVVETRLLIKEQGHWVPHTYVWDADQRDATRKVAGVFVDVAWIDAAGAARTALYSVPSQSQCYECHGTDAKTSTLGLKTAQLDRPGRDGLDQLTRLAEAGLFETPPPIERERFAAPDDEAASLSLRARSYLDANCAHCHSAAGDAASKALYLDFRSTDPATASPTNWGVCKVPTSAGGSTCGHVWDVVPGDAESSVLICRMRSTEGKDQMPPIGRRLAHAEGIALLSAWIDAMEPTGCR